ncbi:MAG: hypothetical protein HYS87_03585 [Candidatus Colwellbacteria bacterium]|nr:hypothetical protein [Candidatus Colwellbacteria bacterium]
MQINWTSHAKFKMKYYRLSEQRVKRVLRSPLRVEEGIAPDTVAMLQAVTTAKRPYEIWAMVNKPKAQNLRVISAWRYPGRTKAGEPLPKEIIKEIREII